LNNINRPYPKSDSNFSDLRLPLSSEFYKLKTPPKDFFPPTNEHFLNQYRDYVDQKSESEQSAKVRRLSTDVRSRRHNVKELKEKFEPQQTPTSRPNHSGRKNRTRSRIHRRHTVGGTKDLASEHSQAKLAFLRESLTSSNLPREKLDPSCFALHRSGSDERRYSVVEPLHPLLESHV